MFFRSCSRETRGSLNTCDVKLKRGIMGTRCDDGLSKERPGHTRS